MKDETPNLKSGNGEERTFYQHISGLLASRDPLQIREAEKLLFKHGQLRLDIEAEIRRLEEERPDGTKEVHQNQDLRIRNQKKEGLGHLSPEVYIRQKAEAALRVALAELIELAMAGDYSDEAHPLPKTLIGWALMMYVWPSYLDEKLIATCKSEFNKKHTTIEDTAWNAITLPYDTATKRDISKEINRPEQKELIFEESFFKAWEKFRETVRAGKYEPKKAGIITFICHLVCGTHGIAYSTIRTYIRERLRAMPLPIDRRQKP